MKNRPDATTLLAEISVPTLVVTGREGPVVPAAESKRMADAVPNAHDTVLPNSGHLAPVEQPIAAGRVIGEFLESIT